jgi:hypothetical protein
MPVEIEQKAWQGSRPERDRAQSAVSSAEWAIPRADGTGATHDALPALFGRLLQAARVAAPEEALARSAVAARVDRPGGMGDAASRQLDDHAHSRKRQDRTKHVSGKGLFVI